MCFSNMSWGEVNVNDCRRVAFVSAQQRVCMLCIDHSELCDTSFCGHIIIMEACYILSPIICLPILPYVLLVV